MSLIQLPPCIVALIGVACALLALSFLFLLALCKAAGAADEQSDRMYAALKLSGGTSPDTNRLDTSLKNTPPVAACAAGKSLSGGSARAASGVAPQREAPHHNQPPL
ncbi:MAG: hypothetical protein KGL39_28380 [Patescibacteria group bacterium]|nr:hypothetical protein [Patescibacteria group bacterium]